VAYFLGHPVYRGLVAPRASPVQGGGAWSFALSESDPGMGNESSLPLQLCSIRAVRGTFVPSPRQFVMPTRDLTGPGDVDAGNIHGQSPTLGPIPLSRGIDEHRAVTTYKPVYRD